MSIFKRRGSDRSELMAGLRHHESIAEVRKQTSVAQRALWVGCLASVLAAATLAVALFPRQEDGLQPEGPKDAHVQLGQDQTPTWIVPRALDQLGVPPDYRPDPGAEQEDHCDDWESWLNQVGAASWTGIAYALVSAPSSAPVDVVDATAHVFRKYRPSSIVVVQCLYGAGGMESTHATINLDAPRPVLTVDTARGPLVVHAGAGRFRVNSGETEALEIGPHGSGGYMYEWQVSVTYVVNAKRITKVIGTPKQPLRTYVGSAEQAKQTDWDPRRRRWL